MDPARDPPPSTRGTTVRLEACVERLQAGDLGARDELVGLTLLQHGGDGPTHAQAVPERPSLRRDGRRRAKCDHPPGTFARRYRAAGRPGIPRAGGRPHPAPGGSLADHRRRDEAGKPIKNPPGMLFFWLP
jgi:hypothetical protein